MNQFKKVIIIIFFTCSLIYPQGWGWGANDAVEPAANGALNYSNGFIVATGIGAISPLAQNPGMARATAVRAAKVDAMRNLLETVMAVTVTSETTVRGAAIENDLVKTKVEGMVKGARIKDIDGDGRGSSSDIRYLSDSSIELEMEVHMSGISEIIMPAVGFAPFEGQQVMLGSQETVDVFNQIDAAWAAKDWELLASFVADEASLIFENGKTNQQHKTC